MGNLAIISSIVLLAIFCAACNAHDQDFLKCLHEKAAGNNKILEDVYAVNSQRYLSLVELSQKNPRWLNSTSQLPLLIVTPQEEKEIGSVIFCSKKVGLEIRVKSGGHDYEGLSFRTQNENPFVMIDLRNLNATEINLEEESIWIQTGVMLGQLYYEIARRSNVHAFPGGLYPGVGSGGHISGGGFGTLLRKYGLAADNVLDARIVDVNGRILDRNAMGEDLFWALRGGGGASFGVVLAWKLQLVRVPEQITVFSFRRKLEARNFYLLQRWQNIAHQYNNDIFMRVLIQNLGTNVPGDKKVVQMTFNGQFLGTPDELVPLLNESFPEFGFEAKDCFEEPVEKNNTNCPDMPCIKKECFQVSWIRSIFYFSGKNMTGPLEILLNPKNNRVQYSKGKSDYVKTPIPEKGWEIVQKFFLKELSPMMILDPYGGRVSEIAEDESPFPHRKGNLFNIQYLNYWLDNSKSGANEKLRWIHNLYTQMEPFVANSPRTSYINYKDLDLGTNDKDYSYSTAKVWGEKYFKGNFERLARVKGKVDPGNFFKNEQSIPVLL
ncbi:FAD-binding Berberine family protein [Forsythia ovata]|uniref:FAD-binding Berberine family protein n=1 Tax=Forsythia ovata TaxID=205694 RepID=A0ABD1V0R7_9LAMI